MCLPKPIMLTLTILVLSGMFAVNLHAQPTLQANWQGVEQPNHIIQPQSAHPEASQLLDVEKPAGAYKVAAEFDRDQLKAINADVVSFDVTLLGSESSLVLEVFGYPASTDHRRYYLEKLGIRHADGKQHRVQLNMAMDDDIYRFERTYEKVRVQLTAKLSPKGVTEASPHLKMALGPVQFSTSGLKLTDAKPRYQSEISANGLKITHRLLLHNKLSKPQSLDMQLDSQQLQHFQAVVHPQHIELAANGEQLVTVTIQCPRQQLDGLSPLYAESVGVWVVDASTGKRLLQPTVGYVPEYLFGVVPPKAKPHPWFLPEADPKRVEAYLQSRRGKKLMEQAQILLTIDTTPPDILHGNPNSFYDRKTNKPLRYHGIGKVWSEGRKAYVAINEFPEKVIKAEAYMHHRYLSEGALKLAKVGYLTGESEYYKQAGKILLEYASRYPDYPCFNPRSTAFQAKIGWAMLQESWWFEPLVDAADMVLGSGVLTAEQETLIRENLMAEAAKVIRIHRVASNQQAEVNASYGGAALLAKRYDLAAEAWDGPAGIKQQWADDFDADGYSVERDQAYHFASLKPMTHFADRLDQLGVPAYTPTFKRLFEAPIARALDGRVRKSPAVYLSAAHHWPEPQFIEIAQDFTDTWEGLKHPLEQTVAGQVLPRISTLEHAGYTVFRQTDTEQNLKMAATINWGSPVYRGGIVLLSPAFYRGQRPINYQSMRIGYGYQNSKFSYTSASGNGLLVDGHVGSSLSAQMLISKTDDAGNTIGLWRRSSTRPGWPGVVWSRAMLLIDDIGLVIDQAQADKPHDFDFLWMLPPDALGKQKGLADATAFPALSEQGDGYQYLQSPQLFHDVISEVNIEYPMGRGNQGNFRAIGDGMTWLHATSQTNWHPRKLPLHILRFKDRQDAWLATVFTGRAPRETNNFTSITRVEVTDQVGHVQPATQAIGLMLSTQTHDHFVLLTYQQQPEIYLVGGQRLKGPLSVLSMGK